MLGTFYEQELQKVSDDVKTQPVFKIARVIRTRKNRNTKELEYLVDFDGYPKRYSQWVSKTEMETPSIL